MRIFFFICVTIIFALAFDIVFGPIAGSLVPSLSLIPICYWLWRLDWGKRLVLACCSGIALDAIGFSPMGTYTATITGLAFLCEPMKSFFSNTESRLVTVLNVGVLVIVFRLLVIPILSLITII